MPTPGHQANEADLTHGRGLLDLSGLSLDDLSALDDSVIADVLRDLVQRRRCGSDSGERYNQFDSSI